MLEDKSQEVTRWEDRHEIVKTIKISDKSFGWMHLVIGRRRKDGELVLRLKRFRNWFTIPSEKYLRLVKKMLEKGAEELGWTTDLSDEEINKLIKEHEVIAKDDKKSKKTISRQKDVIEKLLEQVGRLREEKFFIALDEFKNDLKNLKKMLGNGATEKDIQLWLYEHIWIFGPNYIEGFKEEINRKGHRIDFLLQRYDTYYDVIELKLPSCKLFVGEEENVPEQDLSRKYTMSSDLKDAISQVVGYLESYKVDKLATMYQKGILIHKPRGIIVLGRTDNSNKRALASLNSYLHDIQILTYDDIIEVANNFIKLIEKKGEGIR